VDVTGGVEVGGVEVGGVEVGGVEVGGVEIGGVEVGGVEVGGVEVGGVEVGGVVVQVGTVITVLAALAVTADCAKILPAVTELSPSVIADLLIKVPSNVLLAPIVATFTTQNMSHSSAPFANLTCVPAAVVSAPLIWKI